MNVNKFIDEHVEIMKNHKKNFNQLQTKNAIKHNKINKSINLKREQFDERKKFNSSHFNLIRNK